MNDETQQTDAGRLEKEEIEDLGTVTLARGGHVIHCLTVIGQIEGHSEAPQGQKTTKYEHVSNFIRYSTARRSRIVYL